MHSAPFDLIPDFIPILGLLDDLILLPLAITCAIRLIPPEVMAERRARAMQAIQNGEPVSRIAAAVVIAIWLGLLLLAVVWGYKAYSS